MKSRTRKAVFIWSIRDYSKSAAGRIFQTSVNSLFFIEQLEWISQSLLNALKLAPPTLEIVVRIFITGGRNADEMPLIEVARDDVPRTSAGNMERPLGDDDDSMYSPRDVSTPTNMPRGLKDFPSVRLSQGRPELGSLLKEEVRSADGGKLSVTGT